jgi:hypothetical protein
MAERKPRKGKGRAGRKALMVGKVRITREMFKGLFKGRKAGEFSIAEDSQDEQVQGFLHEMSEKAPRYVERGAFIVQGRDGRWKVNVFGGDDFRGVLADVIRVALLGLMQGAED